ncbi:short-chain dehydrogenase/reductase family 9C member 7 isoform X2 [Parasteatoda tepidariorum]|uniref:short-chain dehydrogenase/reductase family 9C member 7 isoform X2 n=1 Tax=Parasteatoda tepidariorum TaxID=114398 RepID=UPI001C726FA0|nr:short-chain dehydrogenase/reductase family 9C member 7 isoform X2 [Parasteatoda tepidariorum]
MANSSRPRTLARSVNDTLQVYGVALIFAFIFLICLPSWLRWCFFFVCGVVFLVNVLFPFVEDWMPRSRVQAAGKAVLITGCDSGFGNSLAQRLDDLGLQVFAGCLLPDGKGAGTLKKSASSRLHIVPLDVTNDESIEKAVKYVTEKLKDNKLWAVVNNAGLNDGGELFWTNNETIKRVIDVNTFGVIKVTKAFLPLLVKFKGRVVTVASAAGRYTYPGLVPYCMSKQATVSFCDGLRLEMYRFGIKVVTVEPWMYKTPITDERSILAYNCKTWEETPQEIKDIYPDNYIQQHTKAVDRTVNLSICDKPEQVVDCLEEGVMAFDPKYSYNPGTLYSRFSFWIYSRLPRPLADFLIVREIAGEEML